MMTPRNKSEISRHSEIFNKLLKISKFLIIKLIPSFSVADIG